MQHKHSSGEILTSGHRDRLLLWFFRLMSGVFCLLCMALTKGKPNRYTGIQYRTSRFERARPSQLNKGQTASCTQPPPARRLWLYRRDSACLEVAQTQRMKSDRRNVSKGRERNIGRHSETRGGTL